MTRIPANMVAGSIHPSKSGDIEVLAYEGTNNVTVRFVNTGHIQTGLQSGNVRRGNAKDPFAPSVLGKGYYGVGKYSMKEHGSAYQCWKGILERCYSPEYHKKQPTYVGCSVCNDWLNFQNFATWYEDNYVEGYQIDKDIRVEGNKVYGPEYCQFVTQEKNNIYAHAKFWDIETPDGDVLRIYNLAKFCKEHSLSTGNMCNVFKGKLSHHKGYKKALKL